LNDLVLLACGEREGFAGLANGTDVVAPEEYGKCYLYQFTFYGWQLYIPDGASQWISSDFLFDIERAEEA
jgi:hypothetical protein